MYIVYVHVSLIMCINSIVLSYLFLTIPQCVKHVNAITILVSIWLCAFFSPHANSLSLARQGFGSVFGQIHQACCQGTLKK